MKYGSTASTGSSTRKEKFPKRQKTNEIKDIISNLPESIIGRILSFLPTKDAVRTSVLSKRWTFMWTSITKLDLDDSEFYSPKRKTGGKQFFINFVNRALILTKASRMESFSLVIANKYDVSLVNTWISEELVLKVCTRCAIKVPTICVHFGFLKLLKLSGIVFTIDSSSSCGRPWLSLPVLKKFEASNCIWLSAKAVTLEAPLLESVFIEQDSKSVSHEPRSCAIKFRVLHLKEFTYCGFGISQTITLSDPSSAHNASANIILYQRENRVLEEGPRAFSASHTIQSSEVLAQQKVSVLPVFGMLCHLELGLVTTGEVLLGILLKSPVLKTLLFKEVSKFDIELLNSAAVPDCLASTLQVVKFGKVSWI
ncbi:Leucine-rich repeat domain superfamily [Sesbania bispinosa]|nr:Leucine-rich repeat domain superfamily [Sesbania bispinosa]